MARGDDLHRTVVVIDVVERDPRGDERRVRRDRVPARPVLMPADRRLRGAARRLVEQLVLPEPDRRRAEERCSDLAEARISSERGQVGIGPPCIVDLAQVVRTGLERQTQHRRTTAAMAARDDALGRVEEARDLRAREQHRRGPLPFCLVGRARRAEVDSHHCPSACQSSWCLESGSAERSKSRCMRADESYVHNAKREGPSSVWSCVRLAGA